MLQRSFVPIVATLVSLSALPSVASETLIWSSFLGGGRQDRAGCVARDARGDLYLAGQSASPDFPATLGSVRIPPNGTCDAFVAKLSADGERLIWCRSIGGSDDDEALALACAPSGALYVAGVTDSRDFPTTPGAFDRSYNGRRDCFVLRLDAGTGALLWSSYLGGTQLEFPCPVLALDSAENPILAGSTSSPDFPATPGSWDPDYNGGPSDAFALAVDASGSRLLWSGFLGGADADLGLALALRLGPVANPEQGIYLAGATRSEDLPVTPGAYDTLLGGGGNAFVARIAAGGGELHWCSFLGGDSDGFDEAHALALDAAGCPVLAGVTTAHDFPSTPDAYDRRLDGPSDAFVCKLDARGARLLYGSYLGGGGDEVLSSVAVDRGGRILAAGWSSSTDFPTTPDAWSTHLEGDMDAVLCRLDADGGVLDWSSYLGGDGEESIQSLCRLPGRAVVLVGWTGWSDTRDFPSTPGAYDPSANGGMDAFVCRFGELRHSLGPAAAGGPAATRGPALAVRTLPRSGSVRIVLTLPESMAVRADIHDPRGRRVRRLLDGSRLAAGTRTLSWNGEDETGLPQAAGIYVLRLTTPSAVQTRKLLLIR